MAADDEEGAGFAAYTAITTRCLKLQLRDASGAAGVWAGRTLRISLRYEVDASGLAGTGDAAADLPPVFFKGAGGGRPCRTCHLTLDEAGCSYESFSITTTSHRHEGRRFELHVEARGWPPVHGRILVHAREKSLPSQRRSRSKSQGAGTAATPPAGAVGLSRSHPIPDAGESALWPEPLGKTLAVEAPASIYAPQRSDVVAPLRSALPQPSVGASASPSLPPGAPSDPVGPQQPGARPSGGGASVLSPPPLLPPPAPLPVPRGRVASSSSSDLPAAASQLNPAPRTQLGTAGLIAKCQEQPPHAAAPTGRPAQPAHGPRPLAPPQKPAQQPVVQSTAPAPGPAPQPAAPPTARAPAPWPTDQPIPPVPGLQPQPVVQPTAPAPGLQPQPVVQPTAPAPGPQPQPAVQPTAPAPGPQLQPQQQLPSTSAGQWGWSPQQPLQYVQVLPAGWHMQQQPQPQPPTHAAAWAHGAAHPLAQPTGPAAAVAPNLQQVPSPSAWQSQLRELVLARLRAGATAPPETFLALQLSPAEAASAFAALVRGQHQQPEDAQQQDARGVRLYVAALWASMGPAVLGIGQPPPRAPQDVGANVWAHEMLRPRSCFDPELEPLITGDASLFSAHVLCLRPLAPLSAPLERAVILRVLGILQRSPAMSARDVLDELLSNPIFAHLSDLANPEKSVDALLWDLKGRLPPGTTREFLYVRQYLTGLGGPAGVLELGRAAPGRLRLLLGSVVAVRALLFNTPSTTATTAAAVATTATATSFHAMAPFW